jgi:hypothetical protein
MIDMTGKKRTKEQRAFAKLLENRQWIADNFDEVFEKYRDLWVAVVDNEVKAHGPDVEKVKQDIGDKLAEAALLRIPKEPPVTPI